MGDTLTEGQKIKRSLPILAPIVLAYVGTQLSQGGRAQSAPAAQQGVPGGGLGDVLGGLLGGRK